MLNFIIVVCFILLFRVNNNYLWWIIINAKLDNNLKLKQVQIEFEIIISR